MSKQKQTYYYQSEGKDMKSFKKYLLIFIFILSVMCNLLLCYFLAQERKAVPSITKFSYSEHDTFVYCEKFSDAQPVRLQADENTFIIGNAKLVNSPEALYLINDKEKIKLSDYEGCGFVINSNGELLYSLNKPLKK